MNGSLEKLEFSKELKVRTTPIPGLIVLDLAVHGDKRGWFKENWQRQKMVSLGLPDFGPVQNNISFNDKAGVTRGIHAEPWDKYVSVGAGKIFSAWVDLREGESFGRVFSTEIDPSMAVFVPRGVGNSFQTLEDNTVYTYLVNDHWSAENKDYAFLNLADSTTHISWPIPLSKAEISDKDKAHPPLENVVPIKPRRILVTGADGQLGKALRKAFPEAEFAGRKQFDITDSASWGKRTWRQYGTIINAAAYTAVDTAETAEGRRAAWNINAAAVSKLAKLASENGIILVHLSSDYVFDGTEPEHSEEEPFSPLGVYGQSKAAGDAAVSALERYYIIRTSWVVGEGKNFVSTMRRLSESGAKPSVVNDQIGRLTFTSDLANAIKHLLATSAPYGTYNVTNDGDPASWADIARKIFEVSGQDPGRVVGISTAEYYKDKVGIAPRPLQSTLNIVKIKNAGFAPRDWNVALLHYLEQSERETPKGTL